MTAAAKKIDQTVKARLGGRVTHQEYGDGIICVLDGRRMLVRFNNNNRPIAQWFNEDGTKAPAKARSLPNLLPIVSPVSFEDKPVPPRPWHVPGLIPGRNVTLLSGDGGVGKSLLALQLALATALASQYPEAKAKWIGLGVTGGRALYLSAEDETDEIHRRLADINAHYGCNFIDLANLTILPLAGEDAVLAAPAGRSDIIEATPLWQRLVGLIEPLKPALVVLDTLADLFAGNENSRPQARQFISMLRGVALRFDTTIVVLSHPSLTGIAAGTGSSGSTGWNNSVRSRLYFGRVLSEIPGEKRFEADPDLRLLTTTKTNYGRMGDEIRVRWNQGMFEPAGGNVSGLGALARDVAANEAFLRLLRLHEEQGIEVSPKPSPSYAPTIFAGHSKAEGMTKRAFKTAMERLLEAGKIRIEQTGPPSRRKQTLTAFAEDSTDGDR